MHTLHFIGVTTKQSSIMRVFPAWAAHLGLDAAIVGVDLPLHAPEAAYRDAVARIRADPHVRGALVTTHKLDLFAACRDLFDGVEAHAAALGETSCLAKRGGRLIASAKDPITAGLALDGFLPEGHFARTGAHVLCLGAGGSAIALTWHLTRPERGLNRPAKVIVTDTRPERLAGIERVHAGLQTGVAIDYVRVGGAEDNDALMARLPPGSLVVNATGLGKDGPGSPLSDMARFPEHGIAWELNYRGDLVFLDQARAQAAARGLQVEDGWTYFVHGWTRVIAEVFEVEIPTEGPGFEAFARIAADVAEGG